MTGKPHLMKHQEKLNHKRKINKYDLKITVEANKNLVDFLYVTLNLNTGRYMPYTSQTINHSMSTKLQHLSSFIKNIPLAINKVCQNYQNTLKESGYRHQLKYPYNAQTKSERNSTKTSPGTIPLLT